MIDKGQWWEFGQDTGDTPLLFTRSALGFLMITETQDLSLISHPLLSFNHYHHYFLCIYKYKHLHVYIYENMLCLYVKYIYI